MGTKKKTPFQLQSLENFYSEEKHPTLRAMEEYAVTLGLTMKQVRRWFAEKRRRDKKENEKGCFPCSSELPQVSRRNGDVGIATKKAKRQDISVGSKTRAPSTSRYGLTTLVEKRIGKVRRVCLQDMLFSPGYILQKVFRKDGPPLGIEFDPLPAREFNLRAGSGKDLASRETIRATRKRKVQHNSLLDINGPSGPAKRHGMGKGLMTVWRATNPGSWDLPSGVHHVGGDSCSHHISSSRKTFSMRKRPKRQEILAKQRRLRDKLLEKKKYSRKRNEVQRNQNVSRKPPRREKCELALGSEKTHDHLDQQAMLIDDEELERRELQAGRNPISCCADTSLGCLLCKDLLSKFPPNSVKMKQPFTIQPWDSSLETVKKLFKAFHFLYTYSVMLDIDSFTLDEFAQAFHDKDSLLLGKIHVALLKLLFVDIDMELSGGSSHHSNKSCKFLALIHSAEKQETVMEFWKKFLNPLTWPEVLRQVAVAAGFGSNQASLQREVIDEEVSRMRKYGLRPGTLKGELFRILSEQGNNGLKVAEMAKCHQIAELNISGTSEELEASICSTLSSDIALFEKISCSTYRLRVNFCSKDDGECHSDTEDSGTVDQLDESGMCDSSDNSDCESEIPGNRKFSLTNYHKRRKSIVLVNGEIDESHPGEPWLLGLMEGEYSDLSIEEKLNALMALIDLLSAGSSVRIEDATKSVPENAPPAIYSGSGGKVKRPPNHRQLTGPTWVYESNRGGKINQSSEETCPVDSAEVMARLCNSARNSSGRKDLGGTDLTDDTHPMQSIFLGSDRRYNRYWLFLGPCNEYDPGHRRVYFESSEDGHWKVIDTEEALSSLLSVLDERGTREGRLIESLDKRKVFIFQAMVSGLKHAEAMSVTSSCQSELDMGTEASSSPISDVDNGLTLAVAVGNSVPLPGAIVLESGKRAEEQKRRWDRLKAFDAWTWKYYLELNSVKLGKRSFVDSLVKCERCHDLYWRDEKHCRICHTTFELDFELEERYAIHAATCTPTEDAGVFPKHKILSSRLQSLKAAVHTIECIMPVGSMIGAWNKSAHRLWVKRLRRTSSVAELLQVLADFVGAINTGWLFHCDRMLDSNIVGEEMVALFPMIPQTSSAVALWLVKLDILLAKYLEGAQSIRDQQLQPV